MSSFKFTNLFGSVYSNGKIIFSNDGNFIISPIGNRVSVYDLKAHSSFTIETLNRKDIKCIEISPDDSILVSIDSEGHCVFTNLKTRIPLHFMNFHASIRQVKYSPCGKYFAVPANDKLKIFISPSKTPKFRPFELYKIIGGFTDNITSIEWSSDSQYICTGSRDSSIRICCLENSNIASVLLRGLKSPIISIFFEHNSLNIFCLDRSATLLTWKYSEEKTFWQKATPVCVRQGNCHLTSCDFEKSTSILVLGFDTGVFSFYDYSNLQKIQQLSLCQNKISSVAVNRHFYWLAFAIPATGQLVVWEYKTESFVMKQRGHNLDMKCVDFSPDGVSVVSGSDGGNIKIWDVNSGFCVVTFSEHTSTVSAVKFSHSGHFIISSSYDGTCRAFDLNRYRNFRTFVSPTPAQFSSVTIDCSDELVCACAIDDFRIFVWSLMTGRLLETLSGHTSVVSRLSFLPGSSKVISCSWDRSVRVWDVLETTKQLSVADFNSDCVHISVHPFKNIVAICTVRAHIIFWDHEKDSVVSTIEGSQDLGLARGVNDTVTAKSSLKFRFFCASAFSPDGEMLIACGQSRYICIYDTQTFILLKRVQTTQNQSFSNVLAKLNSSKMTEAGPVHVLEDANSEDEDFYKEKSSIKVPGSLKHDFSLRKTKPEVVLRDVSICPTGRSFIVVSTEGLLIYSKDEQLFFNPTNLNVNVTRDYIIDLLNEKFVEKALLASVSIGEADLISQCLECLPYQDIPLVSHSLPLHAHIKILGVISEKLDRQTNHIEFYVRWCHSILTAHGLDLKNQSFMETNKLLPLIRKIQKALNNYQSSLGKL